MKLVVEVVDIRGKCPVYEVGDTFELEEGYKLQIPSGRQVCMHGLAALMPIYNALAKGIRPQKLGLMGKEASGNEVFVQCLDPVDQTGGGTAIFKIRKEI
jgi:uncharacterized repeat protein (TIGR04076 family)